MCGELWASPVEAILSAHGRSVLPRRKLWCTAVVDDPIISIGGTENERTETFDIRFAPVVGVGIFAGVEVRASRCR